MTSKETACITGATSGIGLAFAHALAARGHDLLLAGRDAGRLAHLANELEGHGRDVKWLAGNLAEEAGQNALCAAITATPGLSLLINNAGVGEVVPLEQTAIDDIRTMIAVNVSAVAALSLAALPAIKGNKGQIINVASGVAFAAMAGAAVYGGTKAFVAQFSRTLALEVEPFGCTVQTLVPGLTRTNLGGAEATGFFNQFPDEWVMSPEDLVQASLVAMDRQETICAPGVQDEQQIIAMIDAMQSLGMGVSSREPAARYTRKMP